MRHARMLGKIRRSRKRSFGGRRVSETGSFFGGGRSSRRKRRIYADPFFHNRPLLVVRIWGAFFGLLRGISMWLHFAKNSVFRGFGTFWASKFRGFSQILGRQFSGEIFPEVG